MAKITKSLMKRVEKIARKLAKNTVVYDDCYQEGLTKICEMIDGHTESYYAQYAYRRMQDYLRKEYLFQDRHVAMNTCESEE